MRQPRYEKDLKDLEKIAGIYDKVSPKFSTALRQIAVEARKTRPRSIKLAMGLISEAVEELEHLHEETCKVLLTAAYALVSPPAHKIFAAAASMMFNGVPSLTPPPGVGHVVQPIPQLPGVPEEVIETINAALSKVDFATLKDGMNVIQTGVGPVAIGKVKVTVPGPDIVPPCDHPQRN